MAAVKRTRHQMEADALVIQELTVKGWGPHAIAAHLNGQRPYKLSAPQISYDLTKLEKRWQTEAVELRTAHKLRLLREINAVRERAWRMLEESAKEHVRIKADLQGVTAEDAAASKPVRITRENAPRYGDPALLRVILECNKREADLFGVDEATHFRLHGEGDTVQATGAETRVVLYLPRKQPEPIDVQEVKPKRNGKAKA